MLAHDVRSFHPGQVHDLVLLPAPLRRLLYRRFRLAGALLIGRWGTFLGKVASPSP